MLKNIGQQRCFNHMIREAVARCPECGRYFCRECITEHEERVLCSNCLRIITVSLTHKESRLAGPIGVLQLICGVMLLWGFFYYIGQTLLELPSSFHEGNLWNP